MYMTDAKETNLQWLSAAHENFDTCIEQRDYNGCLAVIEDVFSAGFERESRMMRETLRRVPLDKFAVKSPIEL